MAINLKEKLEANKISIAKLAEATNVSYALVLKKSREPIVGAVYDPNAINYTALSELFTKRNVDLEKIDFEALAKQPETQAAAKDMELVVGQKHYLSYFKANFEIVYKTSEYVCILQEGSTQPKVMKNSTFMSCRPKTYVPSNDENADEEIEAEAEAETNDDATAQPVEADASAEPEITAEPIEAASDEQPVEEVALFSKKHR